MRLSRFMDEQIIGMLKEQEAERQRLASAASKASPRRPSASSKAKYGWMDVSDARDLGAKMGDLDLGLRLL